MMKRRWALLGFNLLLATIILVQPGKAASICDYNACTCACLQVWDACFESQGEDCHRQYNKCMKKTKCKPKIL